jgi:hypothetical protein
MSVANQDATKLEGFYLGRSDRPDCWRLYLTRSLSRYLEFRKVDTLHAERLATGRIVAWLRLGAGVEEGRGATAEDFLKGDLLANLGGTSAAESIRRLLGIGMGICGDDKNKKPGKTTFEGSCNPAQCSGPACPKDSINNC